MAARSCSSTLSQLPASGDMWKAVATSLARWSKNMVASRCSTGWPRGAFTRSGNGPLPSLEEAVGVEGLHLADGAGAERVGPAHQVVAPVQLLADEGGAVALPAGLGQACAARSGSRSGRGSPGQRRCSSPRRGPSSPRSVVRPSAGELGDPVRRPGGGRCPRRPGGAAPGSPRGSGWRGRRFCRWHIWQVGAGLGREPPGLLEELAGPVLRGGPGVVLQVSAGRSRQPPAWRPPAPNSGGGRSSAGLAVVAPAFRRAAASSALFRPMRWQVAQPVVSLFCPARGGGRSAAPSRRSSRGVLAGAELAAWSSWQRWQVSMAELGLVDASLLPLWPPPWQASQPTDARACLESSQSLTMPGWSLAWQAMRRRLGVGGGGPGGEDGEEEGAGEARHRSIGLRRGATGRGTATERKGGRVSREGLAGKDGRPPSRPSTGAAAGVPRPRGGRRPSSPAAAPRPSTGFLGQVPRELAPAVPGDVVRVGVEGTLEGPHAVLQEHDEEPLA
jgi:hypothetical protein